VGHTCGMKAAVSIPDEVFAEADRLAKQLNTSRSQLYSRALKEFLARHAPDQVTDAMNRVCDEVASSDSFVQRAARGVVKKIEW
jgi:metal-responsive CopG/Arc/MetJ family transcriptional regulator